MNRFLAVFVMLVLSASLFAVDVDIPENEVVSNGGAIVSDVQHVGTLIWDLEVQSLGLVDSVWSLGVQLYAGHFLIITEGQATMKFHVIDILDSTVHSFDQSATSWGYRDLCMDEGDTIYASYTSAVHGWVLDTIAWTMTYANSYNGITNPNRALAYVPGDTFWTANFSSALGWFTKGGSSGNGSPNNSCYGAAYVPKMGTVWYHGQVTNAGGWECTWFEYDIVANAWADTAYCPVPAYAAGYTNKMAGGGCFVQDFLGMGPALIGLCQGDQDFVYAFNFPALAVEEVPVEIPSAFSCQFTSSNITSSDITLRYALPTTGNVNFIIFDVTGRTVHSEYFSNVSAGIHTLTWSNNVAAGSYFYRLEAANNAATGMFVITK